MDSLSLDEDNWIGKCFYLAHKGVFVCSRYRRLIYMNQRKYINVIFDTGSRNNIKVFLVHVIYLNGCTLWL